MNSHRLSRLLWRCDYGSVDRDVLALEMREVLQRLRDESIDVRDSATVRLWDEALLAEYDEAMHAAGCALDLRQLRGALQQIRRAERIIESMRALVQASDDVDRATTAMEEIHDLAGTAALRRLPAVASLAQILDLAKQCIVERRSAQGSRIAGICLRLAAELREREIVTVEERAALEKRIDAVGDLCDATRPFVDAIDDEPTHDGTLTTLRLLLTRQYVHLGRRLLSELEIQLAGRRRFFLYLQRKQLGHAATLEFLATMRALIRERSWDGAVDHGWHLSIAGHLGALEEQRRRATAVAVEIQQAVAQLETSHE